MKKILILLVCAFIDSALTEIPLVINTWKFVAANEKGWEVIKTTGKTAIDAVAFGCSICEIQQCDHTVGYGGSPDEDGESTLDAMIFDGTEMNMGAIGGIRRIKEAMAVARDVLERTKHSLLVGDKATKFAVDMGYKKTSLSSNFSTDLWKTWKDKKSCQPNFWMDVIPDPQKYCGPYSKQSCCGSAEENDINFFNSNNHDTIGMIAIDSTGKVVAGTSTNGASFKIPGRVGDSPIPGAGAFADSEVGAAVATGDGDVMMRFLPSFLAVEEIRRGSPPDKAAQLAISRIKRKYPNFFGAVIAVTKSGDFGAACNGMNYFPFVVANDQLKKSTVHQVDCNVA